MASAMKGASFSSMPEHNRRASIHSPMEIEDSSTNRIRANKAFIKQFVFGQMSAPGCRLHAQPIHKSPNCFRRHPFGWNVHTDFFVVGFDGDHVGNIQL
jgi:hypothetical protein